MNFRNKIWVLQGFICKSIVSQFGVLIPMAPIQERASENTLERVNDFYRLRRQLMRSFYACGAVIIPANSVDGSKTWSFNAASAPRRILHLALTQ